VAVSLGCGHVCARLAFTNDVTIVTAALVRSCVACVLLTLLLRWRGLSLAVPGRALRGAILLGVLISLQTVFIQKAVALMPVALALLVFYAYPFFTGLGASLAGEARFTLRLGVTLAVAFVGLALVLGVAGKQPDPYGIAAALLAAAAFSLALVLTPRLAPALAPPVRTFFMLATTATIFLVAAAATQSFRLPGSNAGWIGLVGLSLFYSVGIISLFQLLPRLGPVESAVVLNLEPVAVAAVAWIALGESLSALQMAGGALVVAAVIGYQVAGARAARAAAADKASAPPAGGGGGSGGRSGV
jgi:drug/metabolite transporter (DMT)-like permease